jgi:hypothetical protein
VTGTGATSAPDFTTPALTSGQAARKAWDDWHAGAPERGRGRPGYDEQADTDAGWEVAADAGIGASGLREELAEARRELAEHRELAHNLGDVRRIDELTAEREKLIKGLDAFDRLLISYTRSMYAANIDVTHGDPGDASAILLEALDGYDGPQWNGTESGTEWLERTREEAGPRAKAAPDGSGPESAVEWAVFYGGPDPGNCAGYEGMPDQAEAEEAAQWRICSGIARRTVTYGPWEVMTGKDDGTETAAILSDPEAMAAVAGGDQDLADDIATRGLDHWGGQHDDD